MPATPLAHRFTKVRAMTGGERRLLLEAVMLLALVRLGLRLLPFRAVRGLLARFGAGAGTAAAGADVTRRVLWAVNAASRPAGVTCLPRALAAHTLLARRGLASDLRIGVTRRPGSPLEAHAWVEAGGGVLIGDLPDLARFKPLADLPLAGLDGRVA